MLLRCVLLLLCLNCVRTTEYFGSDEGRVAEFNRRFSLWPSVHNAARLMRVRREVKVGAVGESEGGPAVIPPVSKSASTGELNPAPQVELKEESGSKDPGKVDTVTPTPLPAAVNSTVSSSTIAPVSNVNETNANKTISEKPVKIDLNNPGVLKRGFIVFGGFALLAVAYFIFYRRKGKNNDSGGAHTTIDANQFRYGVLQSEDRRDNMELSRVPLTMESDEDEDEDLEIFDLEQKKKSMSYVNLQTNDEDIVFSPNTNTENDRDNLLLDIEDGNSDTLINWSSNGSKSIL